MCDFNLIFVQLTVLILFLSLLLKRDDDEAHEDVHHTPVLVSAHMMMGIEVLTHRIWVHSSTLIPFTDLTKLNVIRKKKP